MGKLVLHENSEFSSIDKKSYTNTSHFCALHIKLGQNFLTMLHSEF